MAQAGRPIGERGDGGIHLIGNQEISWRYLGERNRLAEHDDARFGYGRGKAGVRLRIVDIGTGEGDVVADQDGAVGDHGIDQIGMDSPAPRPPPNLGEAGVVDGHHDDAAVGLGSGEQGIGEPKLGAEEHIGGEPGPRHHRDDCSDGERHRRLEPSTAPASSHGPHQRSPTAAARGPAERPGAAGHRHTPAPPQPHTERYSIRTPRKTPLDSQSVAGWPELILCEVSSRTRRRTPRPGPLRGGGTRPGSRPAPDPRRRSPLRPHSSRRWGSSSRHYRDAPADRCHCH